MNALARLDTASQLLVQRFFRKIVLFATFAAVFSLPGTRGLPALGAVLQMQFFFAGGCSLLVATILRQRFAAERLTYWDEAVAFSGLAALCHFGARVTGF